MIRQDKTKLVEEMNVSFRESPHMILASFSGVTVNQANELRRKIDGIGGKYRVIKNRLAKRAAEGTPVAKLADRFVGPCAVATHADDPVALAKALSEFVKDNPQVEILAGLLDADAVLEGPAVGELAKLPAMPELRSQLLALFQTPATMLVRLLGTPGTQLARVIDAKSQAGDAAEAPAADE